MVTEEGQWVEQSEVRGQLFYHMFYNNFPENLHVSGDPWQNSKKKNYFCVWFYKRSLRPLGKCTQVFSLLANLAPS